MEPGYGGSVGPTGEPAPVARGCHRGHPRPKNPLAGRSPNPTRGAGGSRGDRATQKRRPRSAARRVTGARIWSNASGPRPDISGVWIGQMMGPAIDQQGRARDIGGILGGEKSNGRGDVAGYAVTPDSGVLGVRVDLNKKTPERLSRARADETRGYCVDPDAPRPELESCNVHQGLHPGLGGAVCAHSASRLSRIETRNGHNGPTVGHDSGGRLYRQKHAGECQVQYPPPR